MGETHKKWRIDLLDNKFVLELIPKAKDMMFIGGNKLC